MKRVVSPKLVFEYVRLNAQDHIFFYILYREGRSQIAIIGLVNVGSFVGPTLTNKADEMSFCSTPLAQQALPTILFQYRIGPTLVTSTVETVVLNQCRANISTPTITCCIRLQPLPSVGPTIACYLGYHQLHVRKFIDRKSEACDRTKYT